MGRIISIGTAVPQYKTKQSDILDFMCSAYNNETASRKLKILFHSSGIDFRHSVVPDFGRPGSGNQFFIPENQPDVEKRMKKYAENASDLAIDAIRNSFSKINSSVEKFGITHLITVTCTALYAPGIDTEIIEKLNLPNDVERTSVNFMGCNAAFPALKIANRIVQSDKNAKVLVVCVELCTLHFQPKYDTDNLLSNTIFGDGAAAAVVVSDEPANNSHMSGLSINGYYSVLLNQGKDLMGWHIKPLNFEMVLNAKVPAFIGENISQLISKVEQKLDFKTASIGKWAVHPGGRKILDEVKRHLPFLKNELEFSYQILREYGNMSSPTILFVLSLILEQELTPGEKIVALGFGPGITIDSVLLTYAE